MAEHKHGWITLSYVFPEEGDSNYEYDEAYEVLYCACGERKTKKMSDDLVNEVREFNLLPSEDIKNEGGAE